MSNRNQPQKPNCSCRSRSTPSTQQNISTLKEPNDVNRKFPGTENLNQENQPVPAQNQPNRRSATLRISAQVNDTQNCCTHKSSSLSTQTKTQTCSGSQEQNPSEKDAAGIVKEMDKKYEKYRKKIQRESLRTQKKCKNIQEMLKKPPWAAPEVPPKKIPDHCHKEAQNPPVSEPKEPPRENSCCGTGQNMQEQQNLMAGKEMENCNASVSTPADTGGVNPCYPCAGVAGSSPEPPADTKNQKAKPTNKLKKFSSPANLRKKLQQYFENKPEDKRNPIGSLIPFYDGTVDLSGCLTRGAKEGLQPWEYGNLVCEHPDADPCSTECSGQGESNTNEKPALQEVECLKNIMPPNLTCQQQLDYIQCIGASDEAIKHFRELQASASAGGVPGSDYGSPAEAPALGQNCGPPMTSNDVNAAQPCPCDQPQTGGMNQNMTDENYGDYVKQLINDARGEGDKGEKSKEQEDEDDPTLQDLQMFGPPYVPPRRTMAETFKLYKEHLSNIRRRYFGAVCKHIDDVEDITPETAAAMVITEDQGLRMKSAPARFYEYLYPDQPSQPLLSVGEVTNAENLPENMSNIVVPLVPPMMLETANYPGLEDPAMLDSPRVIQIGPSMNLADEPGISEGTRPQDIVEAVTGQIETFYGGEEEDEDEEGGAGGYDFDIKLNQAMPPHYSRFQLRGSQAPNWFPGYYVAMPSRFGVAVQEKIGNVLEKAWEETQPETVRPRDGATIIGY